MPNNAKSNIIIIQVPTEIFEKESIIDEFDDEDGDDDDNEELLSNDIDDISSGKISVIDLM
jgi:hypothetical protein